MWWFLLQIIIGISFWVPVLLFVIGKFRKKKRLSLDEKEKEPFDYAIVVTAYQQVGLIEHVVQSILNIKYNNYLIYVVADNCDVSGFHISHGKLRILQPPNVLASNIRSHFYAIENFEREHDIITIIDSDNLVSADYLTELNVFFAAGYKAVQGVRKAKNLNTVYACLDEAGDIYYRYVDRKLSFDAGSSASLAGSGMAFLVDIYKKCLKEKHMSGAGFDKVLQYELLKRNEQIAFAEKVVVYDEKTAKSDQLVKQRARWINTWFRFWILGLRMMISSVAKLNWNQFAFALMLMRPPLFLMMLIVGVLCLVNIFVSPWMLIYWGITLLVFAGIFAKALRYFKADQEIYKSIKYAPRFMFYQFIALLKAKKANKISVATQHDESSYKNNL
ncbi:MAG TPA: glycosyltransferase [Niabella sp.]|nr:glycosyltransferase [Niabella sp.]